MAWVGGNGNLIKLFGGSGTAYAWSGNAALDNGSKHPSDWDLAAGDYTLEVRGRSRGFSFDRLIFVGPGANDNDAKGAAESEVAEPSTGTGTATGSSDGTATGTGTATGSSAGTATGSATGTATGDGGGTSTGTVTGGAGSGTGGTGTATGTATGAAA